VSKSPSSSEMPSDPHLVGDISVPAEDAESRGDHVREDINMPDEPNEGAPEFSDNHFTSGQTNAGQQVPGLSPDGEYGEKRLDDLAEG
jgi:hypothetical protein